MVLTLAALERGVAEIGIALTEDQMVRFVTLADELIAWNDRVNLTSIVDPQGIQVRHFLDSLTCAGPVLSELAAGPNWRCIDVGSGAGFPGLPLAIAFPTIEMTLLDATLKKVGFLEHVVARLGLARATVLHGRAEEAAREPAHRDAYELALARALAPLPTALELCLPFVRPGGRLILPRGSDLPAQLEGGRRAARELGAELRAPVPLAFGGGAPGRSVVVADKLGPTPERYPRRVGVAAKRPLG